MATKSKNIKFMIYDLHIIARDFDKMFSDNYKNLVARLVVEIGKTTAYDTGLIRDIISNILYDLGRPELVNELEYKVFEFWRTRSERETDDVAYSVNMTDTDYDIVIEDDGFYNQQIGKVSNQHPRQDANVIAYNVDFCVDNLETGNNIHIERVFNELNNIIVNLIEKGV